MRALITRTKDFIQKHDRTLSAGALLFGFVFDSLTLRRIDLLVENLAITGYLLLSALSIVILAHREREYARNRFLAWGVAVAPLALQIAFGALFSAFVIFFFRSASISASWPFLAFLLFMLVGNEAFRSSYERTVFHVSVWYVALLSYAIMLVPILTRSLGVWEFLSGVSLSLVVVAVFIAVLHHIAPKDIWRTVPRLSRTIVLISAGCVFAYAANLIPPVPLALSDTEVAHDLLRVGDAYTLYVEPDGFFGALTLSERFHRAPGEPVYVWTAVFAPARLSASIVHEWERFDGRRWVTESEIVLPITGGREEGYRVYSKKENVLPGAWRVSVKTNEGLIIGRVRFTVIESSQEIELIRVRK